MEENEVLTQMETIITGLLALGGPGVVLAAVLVVFNKITNSHKEERSEWQKSNHDNQKMFIDSLKENTHQLSTLNQNMNHIKDLHK